MFVKANEDCVCELITQKDWYKSLWYNHSKL